MVQRVQNRLIGENIRDSVVPEKFVNLEFHQCLGT
jgi:hypothetical protein